MSMLVGAALAAMTIGRCAAEDAVTSAPNSAVQSAVRDARDAALRSQQRPRPHAPHRHTRVDRRY
jgi:hypothetical protein